MKSIVLTQQQADVVRQIKLRYQHEENQVKYIHNESKHRGCVIDLVTSARIVTGETYEVVIPFQVYDIVQSKSTNTLYVVHKDAGYSNNIPVDYVNQNRDNYTLVCKAEHNQLRGNK